MLDIEKSGKFWAFFGIIIFALLTFPLLQIYNRATLLAGIPLLLLHLHLVWLFAIVGLYILGRRLSSRK
jgi:hypothetical protein